MLNNFKLYIPPNSEGYTGYSIGVVPGTGDVESPNEEYNADIADSLNFYETNKYVV